MSQQYTYRNLIVWQRAQELALAIMQLVQHVPQSWANAVLVRQIVSAATSIGANIAEGHGRYAIGAHRNYLSIAKGSAAETDSWSDLFRRSGWISAEDEQALHQECVQIMAMLTAKIRNLERMGRATATSVHEPPSPYAVSIEETPAFPFTLDDYQPESVPGS